VWKLHLSYRVFPPKNFAIDVLKIFIKGIGRLNRGVGIGMQKRGNESERNFYVGLAGVVSFL
jgi:hypothetical protein